MKKTAFVFPGQGSQYVGMGAELIKNHRVVRETFEEAGSHLGFDVKSLCLDGDLCELTKTFNTQPAILTLSIAMFRLFMEKYESDPQLLAGHSLGEFSALVASEAITFRDGLQLVRKRGELMEQACKAGRGAMADLEGIELPVLLYHMKDIGGGVVVSNINGRESIVISGQADAVGKVCGKVRKMGVKVVPLLAGAPFHSPIMESAARKFAEELEKVEFKEPRWPVLSNVSVEHHSRIESEVLLIRQMVEPVRWLEIMEQMELRGVEMTVEFGPKNILTDLIRKNTKRIVAISFDKKEERSSIDQHLYGDLSYILRRTVGVVETTPNRNTDMGNYQKEVMEPAGRIRKIVETTEREKRFPTIKEVQEAVNCLNRVLDGKKIGEKEKRARLKGFPYIK